MGEPDRQSVTLEFKISKNYNSIGASVGFSSDRKDGETDEVFFNRVRTNVEDKFDALYNKGSAFLG